MRESVPDVLRDLARGLVGALLLGVPLLYTMEAWWAGWRLSPPALLAYFVGGLLAVLLLVRAVGFRAEDAEERVRPHEIARNLLELAFVSFSAAYALLFLFGILHASSSLSDVVRLSVIQAVPMGFGAALANRLLSAEDEADETEDASFSGEMAAMALGAVFFALPVAPTDDMARIAAHASWWRLVALVLVALVVGHLALYEVELRGGRARVARLAGAWHRWGETFAGFAVALAVSVLLLAGFGRYDGATLADAAQQTVVLAFLATLGGAAGRVVV